MTWRIDCVGCNVVIYGPGQLEIILHDFDPVKAEPGQALPAKLVGTLVERHWRYPIEEGVWLEGMSIRDPEDLLDRPAMHVLHVGNALSWYLPETVAENLHRLMRGVGGQTPGPG